MPTLSPGSRIRVRKRRRRLTKKEARWERAPLNDRQALFVTCYVRHMNGKRAAIEAGYSSHGPSAEQRACVLLKNPRVRGAIEAEFSAQAMGKDEVLARLSANARFDLGDYVDPETGQLKIDDATKKGMLRFVKKIRRGANGTTLEFHDAQAATVKLGEFHKLFTQKHELGGPGGSPLFDKGCIRIVVGGETAEESEP